MTKFEEVAQKEIEQASVTYEAYQGIFKAEVPEEGLVVRSGNHTLCFPWLEFAKNWHSDEEFKAEQAARKKEYEIHQDIYSKTAKKLNKAELEIASLKSQLEHQPLPEVPEWLDIEIKHFKSTSKHPTVDVIFGVADAIVTIKNGNTHSKLYDYLFCGKQDVCNQHQAIFALAFITGKYEFEKPQLFYIELPNVYGLKNKIFVSKVENGTIVEFSNGKNYALKFTEQEIKSIDERYWQFAVPVEDGE